MASNNIIDEIASNCVIRRMRTLNRVLTRIFDEEFRPFGIKASQLNILVVVAKAGPIRRIDIGKILSLDPSTLTRNLSVMRHNDWIEECASVRDGRANPVLMTTKGRKLIHQVAPAWRRAQAQATKYLGDNGAKLIAATSNAHRNSTKTEF